MDMNAMMAAAAAQQGMGGNAAEAAGPPDDGKMINLIQFIDQKECYAKNAHSAFPLKNLFIGDTRLGCKSDADEQLILHIEFQEFVKLHSIKLTEYNLGSDPDQNPTFVKLFVNRENIGFEDANDIDPTAEYNLTDTNLKEDSKPIVLKFVKFQRVKSLTIFIEENNGADITSLGMLQFYGRPIATTNMSDLKKSG